MELPANMLTPSVRSLDFPAFLAALTVSYNQIFCEKVAKEFQGLENVDIHVRDEGTYFPFAPTLQDSRYVRLGEGTGHAYLLGRSTRYSRTSQVPRGVCLAPLWLFVHFSPVPFLYRGSNPPNSHYKGS